MAETRNMKTLFLPNLKSDTGIPVPPDPGTWVNRPSLLSDLAKDIDTGHDIRQDLVSSIPTPWARLLLFRDALIDDGHPAHKAIKEEWFGLLGTIALQARFKVYSIEFKKVNLSTDAELVKNLFGTFNLLKPELVENKIFLMYLEGVLVGGTSPYTLLFTPEEYSISENLIPWSQKVGIDYRLTDPLKQRLLSIEDKKCLAGWADRLVNTLKNEEKVKNFLRTEYRNTILGLLTAWSNSLVEGKDSTVTYGGPFVGLEDAYRQLLQPAKADELDIKKLPFYIQNAKKDVLLVTDPENFFGTDLAQNPVFASYSVENVYKQIGREKSGDKIGTLNIHWVCPERHFFTPKIVKLSEKPENVLTTPRAPKAPRYISPFNPEIMDYFEPENVDLEIEEERDADGRELVKCSLHLRTNAGEVTIKKSYNIRTDIATTEVISSGASPTLAIWPNFQHPAITRYYLYYATYGVESVNFRCRTVNPDTNPDAKPKKYTTLVTDPNSYIEELDHFPEFIEVKDMEGNHVGLIFPQIDRQTHALHLKWLVGVDFGTSNTNISYKRDDAEMPEPAVLQFKNRCQLIFNGKPEHHERSFRQFFPKGSIDDKTNKINDEIPLPLSTIFAQQVIGTCTKPILHGVCVFLKDIVNWKLGKEEKDYILPDLKWSEDSQRHPATTLFLTELFYMILVEALKQRVSDVTIRWSYPSAYPPKLRNKAEEIWRQIISAENSSDGFIDYERGGGRKQLRVQLDEPSKTPTMESLCIGKYCIRHMNATPAAVGVYAVFMDIGGGTTDLSIQTTDGIVMQTSIRLAGNILVQCYSQESGIQGFRQKLADIIGKAILPEDKKFESATLNGLLRSHPEIGNRIITLYGEEVPVKQARTILCIEFAGLVYHVGQMLRSLAGPEAPLNRIELFFCGNGSQQIRWIGRGFDGILQEMIRSQLSKPQLRIDIHYSQEPKVEVCKGVLWDSGVKETGATVLYGENFKTKDSVLESIGETMAYEKVKRFVSLDIDKPLEIERFYGLIREKLIKEMSLDGKILNGLVIDTQDVSDYVSQQIHLDIIDKPPEDALIQSLFILGLDFILKEALKLTRGEGQRRHL